MEKRQRGWLLWFGKRQGYGFIGGDNGRTYFFKRPELIEKIEDGQRVSFVLKRYGRHMNAEQVRKVRKRE